MSHSEMIRHLLTRFRALKPKEIERLLAERGVTVDANLIGVARLRHRRATAAEERWSRLLAELLLLRPDLHERALSSFDEVAGLVGQAAVTCDGLSDEELVKALAATIPRQAQPESAGVRAARAYMAVLDRHPEFRLSIALATGSKPESVQVVSVRGDLEGLTTDEEMEAAILDFLDRTFPVGPTAEAVARAALSRGDEARRDAERDRADRAARVFEAVAAQVRPDPDQHAALLPFVQQFVAAHPDWDNEVLTDWLTARLSGSDEDDEAGSFSMDLRIDGLTIRARN